MLGIDIICVGKLKERFFKDAADEYLKRLSSYAKVSVIEVAETAVNGENIASALAEEKERILKKLSPSAYIICMCIEGKKLSSEKLSELFSERMINGVSKICVIIGGSNGIDESIKQKADFRLSMSDMTFPHHLARVMVLEQIYRAFKIAEGSGYHK